MICLLSPWLIDMWQWGIIELMTPISCLHASKDRPSRPILPIALEKYFIYMNFIFHRSIQEANKTMCFKITKNKNEASNDVVFRCIYWNCSFHKEQCLTKEGSVFCNGPALVLPIFCLTSPWPHQYWHRMALSLLGPDITFMVSAPPGSFHQILPVFVLCLNWNCQTCICL